MLDLELPDRDASKLRSVLDSVLGVGDSDTLTNDSFGSVTLQNAAATGFRLYFDVNNQNSGSIVVMIQGWNTKPTITIN